MNAVSSRFLIDAVFSFEPDITVIVGRFVAHPLSCVTPADVDLVIEGKPPQKIRLVAERSLGKRDPSLRAFETRDVKASALKNGNAVLIGWSAGE